MAPDENTNDRNDGSVLSPDELDITEDDNVVEIDEGRYVISADESSPTPISGTVGPSGTPESEKEPAADPGPELTEEAVHAWLEEYVGSADAQYGFDATAKFEGTVDRKELFSNDVVTTFENLLVWYVQHVGGDTPVEDVLGILLLESNAPVRYPVETLRALVAEADLTPDDPIRDLLEASEEGVRFPP